MTSHLEDPDHWRAHAAEARAIAAEMKDQIAARTMLDVATSYDLLAKRAARRYDSKPKG
jgi:hypothetical protein